MMEKKAIAFIFGIKMASKDEYGRGGRGFGCDVVWIDETNDRRAHYQLAPGLRWRVQNRASDKPMTKKLTPVVTAPSA